MSPAFLDKAGIDKSEIIKPENPLVLLPVAWKELDGFTHYAYTLCQTLKQYKKLKEFEHKDRELGHHCTVLNLDIPDTAKKSELKQELLEEKILLALTGVSLKIHTSPE